MEGVNVRYTRELRKKFGYSATWIPTAEVRLGDVGVLYNHQFERKGSLEDYDIGFQIRGSSNTGFLNYSSSGEVSFSIKAAGEPPNAGSVLADVDAGITVSFGSQHAILFQASECAVDSIENLRELGEKLLALHEGGKWPEDYVVVTEVLLADRASILISSSDNASIEFKAKADIHLSEYSLVDAEAGLLVARSRNVGTQIIGQGGLTPLFKARGVRRRFLRPTTFGGRDGRGKGGMKSSKLSTPKFFGEVDYDSFDRDL